MSQKNWLSENVPTAKTKMQQIQELIAGEKDKPCMDCGIKYPSYVMQFDHVKPGKVFNISRATREGVSLKLVEAEIRKCELVCSNCHAERTHQYIVKQQTLRRKIWDDFWKAMEPYEVPGPEEAFRKIQERRPIYHLLSSLW